MCNNHHMISIEDAIYRDHEIVISECLNCKTFTVDVRVDNFDGEFLEGYIDKSIFWAMTKAIKAVDKHEMDKLLLVNVPF